MALNMEEFKQIFKEQEDEATNADLQRKQAELELKQAKLELAREKQQQQYELQKAKYDLARAKYEEARQKQEQNKRQSNRQDIIWLITILLTLGGTLATLICLLRVIR